MSTGGSAASSPCCRASASASARRATLSLGLAVASSSPSAWVQPWLERHDLMPLFDAVCTRDDVQHVKPAPDLFLLAAERLGVEPAACVVFEDSPNGLRAAHTAGMKTVAIPNGLTRGLPMPAAAPGSRLDGRHDLGRNRGLLGTGMRSGPDFQSGQNPMRTHLQYGTTGLDVDLPSEHVTVITPRFVAGLPDERAAFEDGGAAAARVRRPFVTWCARATAWRSSSPTSPVRCPRIGCFRGCSRRSAMCRSSAW